jgi:hypothetical protein
LKRIFSEHKIQPLLKTINKLFIIIALLFGTAAFAQQKKPVMYGTMITESGKPIEGITVFYDVDGKRTSVITNEYGRYVLELPANTTVDVFFAHQSFKLSVVEGLSFDYGEYYKFDSIMFGSITELPDLVIQKADKREAEGLVAISPGLVAHIPGANQDIATVLRTFGSTNNNNELSTGYNVRGGNYDENLVYVNDIEVYRPFLIRSGQQEGLSFTNTAMVSNIAFSAGGFQSRFGDKLSSVLDITYRRPDSLGAQLEASFLGGSLTLEGASKNKKWTGIVGARYRDNSLLVNSQDTETNFRPTFADIQSYFTFRPSAKWEFGFLGNISQNIYHYQPLSRQTNFGTVDDPQALIIYYQGQEKDEYQTYFGAFTSEYKASGNLRLKFIGSVYHTQEQEHFDILGQYLLGEVDNSLGSETAGQVQFPRGVGSQLIHARNNLDALIVNAEVKSYYTIARNAFEGGLKFTREDFRDRLYEWEVIDSAGFSLNPPFIDAPNDQPYTPYTGPLVPYQNVRALNYVTIDRLSGYLQWSRKDTLANNTILFYNAGVRAHQWQVTQESGPDGNSQVVVSPRAQFAVKPGWDTDMLFRVAGGWYYQPPFYRELRDSVGVVQPNVKAQRSIHLVAGHDYSFTLGGGKDGNGIDRDEKKFKLVTEVYYKQMDDVNTYTLENVRIRYRANNDATAYAYGADVRLNGEFVPGTDSWVSFGYMKTEENINDRGYIARPTDQRLKFGLLFQDYMPAIENLKMYLNLVYNTGLPGGSPSYADSYQYQTRLNDYRRADAGFSYVFAGPGLKKQPDAKWLQPFKELSLGLEIFNLFNNLNAITNTWVRDVYTRSQVGIPNYLTTRVFSLKLMARI